MRDHTTLSVIICGGRKTEKQHAKFGHAGLRARVAVEEGFIRAWVSQSIGQNHGPSMNIATFSTPDLREQGRKYYVASYRANQELVIPRMFTRELRQ